MLEICGKSSFGIISGDRPKLCENCAFPKNFHTRKLGEITVFFAVKIKQPSNYLVYLGQHHLQAVTARNGTTHKHLHNVWARFQMSQLRLGLRQSVRDGQPTDYVHLYRHTLRRFYCDALGRKKEIKS